MSAASRPRVVVTRDESLDDGLSRGLVDRGAEPVALQTVATAPPEDPAPLAAAVERLAGYDWIVFTSARAVDAVCAQPAWRWSPGPSGPGKRDCRRRDPGPEGPGLQREGPGLQHEGPGLQLEDPGRQLEGPGREHDGPGLGGTKIAAVGARTADRLESHGIKADLVPPTADAAALVEALLSVLHAPGGARILWPRSSIAPMLVADALSAAGATVDAPIAYRTVLVRPPGIDAFVRHLEAGRIAAVAFLSPSSARGLAAALSGADLRTLHGRTLVASLGTSTSAALRELGAPPDVEPSARSADALAAAICDALAATRSSTR